MKHSKKAMVAGIMQTVGIVLGIMLIFLSVMAISTFLKLFSSGANQGTANTFQSISDAVDVMVDPRNTQSRCKVTNGYIDPDYAIVGFNKAGTANVAGETGDPGSPNFGYVEEHCGIIDDNIYKPTSCLDEACICLCRGGQGDVSGNDCKSNPRCLRAPFEIEKYMTFEGTERRDLVIYGKTCFTGAISNIVGAADRVVAGYIVDKSGSTVTVQQVVDESSYNSRFGDVPECEDMIADASRPEPEETEESSAISVET